MVTTGTATAAEVMTVMIVGMIAMTETVTMTVTAEATTEEAMTEEVMTGRVMTVVPGHPDVCKFALS